jgi:transposase
VPPEQVREVHECKPTQCKHCHADLDGNDSRPERHQRVELPKIVPEVEEFRLHTLRCPKCRKSTQAALPEELRQGAYGPQLLALIGLLTGVYRMPKRHAQRLLSEVFGIEMSLGMVSKCERRLSLALIAPVAEVGVAVCNAPHVNIDETGWFQEGQHFWLWSASTPTLAYFCIADSRGAEVAEIILGSDYGGIVTSDRLGSYGYIEPEQRQVCWAHLDRNFAALADGGGPGARLGHAMQSFSRRLWRAWHALRAGKRSQTSFQAFAHKLRRKVHAVLAEFAAQKIPKASRFAQNLLDIEPALWTFVDHPGVEPTNNAAERALRPGVLSRKISFGTRSSRGSYFIARIMSAAETLHRQGRRVYDFLVELIDCYQTGRPLPSLLHP